MNMQRVVIADEQEMNQRMLESEMHNLMQGLEEIFMAADREIAKDFTEVYLSTRVERSRAAQLLLKMGSRIFPQLGEYLNRMALIQYPLRTAFWSMLINMISTKERISDKPLALSQFNEWVNWLRMKYPH